MSLIIFLLGFAIYACGETVRQRMELQNAADSAAYSAALVQADTISRVAVINKAMAWNYVMMTRRQMDHIVDAWLARVLDMWGDLQNRHAQLPEHLCVPSPFRRDQLASGDLSGRNPRRGGPSADSREQLSGCLDPRNRRSPYRACAEKSRRAAGIARKCIDSMNRAEKELIDGMKERIENAVEFAVNANVALTENDRKVREKREIDWTIYNLRNASDYFELLKGDETQFLSFGDFFRRRDEDLRHRRGQLADRGKCQRIPA
ncbi:MAG: pilus assembly protein TadG-related protein [Lentisphaeria bacterium]|nr:MAG: pilus assembly protein TadG-related protein [Lentisphaeria bacterium]